MPAKRSMNLKDFPVTVWSGLALARGAKKCVQRQAYSLFSIEISSDTSSE